MKKKITPAVFALAFLFAWNTNSFAQCAPDQSQPLNNGGTSERNLPGYYDWQSFTAGISGGLCEVVVMYCNSNIILAGTGILNVYDGTGISGTQLSSDTVMVNGTSFNVNTPFWNAFALSSPPNLVAGQIYTWQFIPIQGGGLPDPYLIQINIPDVYAGGVSYNFGTGGDIAFETHVDPTLGIYSTGMNNECDVYPNPANNLLTIKFVSENSDYFLLDESGRIVLTGKFDGAKTIHIEELATGIYFLKTENSHVTKIVKE